jgi:hypothetical protein
MDYGHPLLFGSFVTPVAGPPQQAVALAQLSERAGLDLVTFQDHPYQPAFLDTWTLLSYVAASTRTIRLATNVANLPLRPPAVLARSAASLDLLSDGRFELGLGAGAFWDAIAAMGGRRLTPGQSLQAVREAIEVIRGVWAADERAVLRVEGQVHRVEGAKRGPAPEHPVEIWLGAYKPRMLALTGERADGWLPSAGYLQPGDLARGNTTIDDAASAAGRTPQDVRRLLNISGTFAARGDGPLQGPVANWVEQLTELALTDGVSVFILGSDSANDLERFALEVAPAVRDAVEWHRREPEGATPVAASVTTAAAPVSAYDDEAQRLGITPTADPGARLTETMPWDEDSRPRRPAAEPQTQYTAQGRAVGAHLVEVHDHLRSELTRLRDLVEQVRVGTMQLGAARSAINEMTMRQNDWTLGAYCASYCRVVTGHHGLEDEAVFPHLRSADATLAPVIDRLEQEHVVIHDVLEQVDRALVALVAHPGDLEPLQQAIDLLTDTLLSHLAYEEQQNIEPLARLGFYPGQV